MLDPVIHPIPPIDPSHPIRRRNDTLFFAAGSVPGLAAVLHHHHDLHNWSFFSPCPFPQPPPVSTPSNSPFPFRSLSLSLPEPLSLSSSPSFTSTSATDPDNETSAEAHSPEVVEVSQDSGSLPSAPGARRKRRRRREVAAAEAEAEASSRSPVCVVCVVCVSLSARTTGCCAENTCALGEKSQPSTPCAPTAPSALAPNPPTHTTRALSHLPLYRVCVRAAQRTSPRLLLRRATRPAKGPSTFDLPDFFSSSRRRRLPRNPTIAAPRLSPPHPSLFLHRHEYYFR